MSSCKSYYSLKPFLLTRQIRRGVVRLTAVHPILWPTGQFRVTQMGAVLPHDKSSTMEHVLKDLPGSGKIN